MYTTSKGRCTGDIYSVVVTSSILFSIDYLFIPNIWFFPFTEH